MRWIIFLVGLAVLSANALSSGWDDMEDFARAGNAVCYQNGQVVIPFTQFRAVVPIPGFIKSVAERHDEWTYSGVNGKYYDTDYNPITSLGIGDTGLFVSDEYRFSSMKNVTVVLSGLSYALIPMYEDISLLKYTFDCPKYRHGCTMVNMSVKNCTYDKEFMYVDFSGLGKNSEVNVTKDVQIIFSRSKLGKDPMEIPITKQYVKTGNDSILTLIPVGDFDETPRGVTVRVTGCIDGLHNIESYMRCQKKVAFNVTPFAEEEEEYVCGPKGEPSKEKFCTTNIPFQEQPPQQKPNQLKKSWEFVRRIVRFTLRIPLIKG